MGLYIRKAVRVGPFKFNLSGSGIGVSTGIKGLRVGVGPRGNYVHMGRGGIYYRMTLSSKPQKGQPQPNSEKDTVPSASTVPFDTHEPLQEIESADVASMVDSTSKALIDELNEKRKRVRLWPFTLALGAGLTIYLITNNFPNWAIYLCSSLSGLTVFAAIYRDTLSKSVVMLYDIEDEVQPKLQSVHDSFKEMANCKGSWHLEAEGRVRDKKYHAGADSVVRRKSIDLTFKSPPYVKTNIDVPAIPVGKQTLFFFPDMVLIFEKGGVGAVSYENLSIDISSQQFIENESVPRDAKIVGHTWRYVNKKGGPDKRFKDNRQIPVALYEDIHFSSATGLNERIELSRTEVATPFASAIRDIGNINSIRR